jgi:prolyl oligopeptidase
VDWYHDTSVADPYRWLENLDTAETRAWLEAQRLHASTCLHALPGHAAFRARLTALWRYPKYGVPHKAGGRVFFWGQDLAPDQEPQQQPVLYVQDTLDGPPVVVLDPNTLSPDGSAAVTHHALSPNGRLVAYALAHGGSDWQEIRVQRVDGGADYPETLRHCKYVGIAWAPDSSGFYYNRHPAPGEVADADRHHYSRIYWHTLGTDQDRDRLVHACPDAKELSFYPIATDDGAYLLLHACNGADPHDRLYYRGLDGDGPFRPLFERDDAHYSFVDNVGATFYVQTDLDAPRGRIVAVDLARPEPAHWRTVVPEGEETIAFVTMAGNALLVVYLHHACHRAVLYDLEGGVVQELALPPFTSITGLWGRRDEPALFLSWESFLSPPVIGRFDAEAGALALVRAPQIAFDGTAYETRQVFYPARDGTPIPMFLTHRKGLALDGDNPTLLYGYGGFGMQVSPAFWLSLVPWLEAGGVFAVANIRGGGEYGVAWHQAAVRERKQTSFDDFVDAAEWLLAQRYTRPARLALMGASNGGLLVATCLAQRPELFGAVICQVPVADMLRYHRFNAGQYWTAEFGNAEHDLEAFRVLRGYSPLHNVREGVAYPATLVTTAENDDRALPLHPMKLAAALQHADPRGKPHLLRVERCAGHGLGKPAWQAIEEYADILAFLFDALGLSHR